MLTRDRHQRDQTNGIPQIYRQICHWQKEPCSKELLRVPKSSLLVYLYSSLFILTAMLEQAWSYHLSFIAHANICHPEIRNHLYGAKRASYPDATLTPVTSTLGWVWAVVMRNTSCFKEALIATGPLKWRWTIYDRALAGPQKHTASPNILAILGNHQKLSPTPLQVSSYHCFISDWCLLASSIPGSGNFC